jgi:(S)-2-hydroxyglutarate dehydrogenase
VTADDRFDVVVVGGGLVGLATAYRLLEARPGLRLALLEKEDGVASHQSGHNSGVVHTGIYYATGSLKARLCGEGRIALEQFAADHDIPVVRSGKVLVALDEAELPRLRALFERGRGNGVPGLEEIGEDRLREIEPHAAGIRALYSPATGAVDFRRVAASLAEEVVARGGEVRTGAEVLAIVRRSEGIRVATRVGELETRDLIACAGLHSDRVAAMTGDAGSERIVPFRGDYYVLTPRARGLVRSMINPIPDPAFPFLGVHFTRRVDGEVWAGPNAVLALAREGYTPWTFSGRDVGDVLAFRGFRKLAWRYAGTGMSELWRDAFKPVFLRALRRYVPELRAEDIVRGPSGVRAQSVDAEGRLVDDFSFGESPHVLHVRNAPSPAATASLAIGRHLAERARVVFGWD